MVAAVVLAVTWPLSRRRVLSQSSDAADVDVYSRDLKEIEEDRARGLLSEEEAAAVRVEVSRRLLARVSAAAQSVPNVAPALAARRDALVFYGVALLVPVFAMGLYLGLGSPSLPDQPHQARVARSSEKAGIAELVAKVEERLRAHPEDGQGWEVVAPVYARLKRFQDAAQAYRNAARLLGPSPRRLAGLGEALALAKDGVVPEEARQAFQEAQKLEPGLATPRFWLALAREQDGDAAGALAEFRALLGETPAGSPWRGVLEERISALGGSTGGKSDAAVGQTQPNGGVAATSAGPGAGDIAAAEKLSPAEREAMITRMVDGLAERLKADGKNLEGWERLMRSYVVLGRKDDARKALADARRALANDAGALASLEAIAAKLGLGS
jgi:cytochrome c-type biogenesis protein CcmH